VPFFSFFLYIATPLNMLMVYFDFILFELVGLSKKMPICR